MLILDQRGTGLIRTPARLPRVAAAPLPRRFEPRTGCSTRSKVWREPARSTGARRAPISPPTTSARASKTSRTSGSPSERRRLRLFAASFGTHVALAAVRAHQDRLDRLVLVGVVGPDQLRRLPSDFDWELAQIASLARQTGAPTFDLIEAMTEVLHRLESQPVTVEVETRDAGRIPIVVGRFDLELYIRNMLASRRTIAHLPALLASMAGGEFSELAQGGRAVALFTPTARIHLRHAMRVGIDPERELRIAKEAQSALLGNVTDFAEERICRAWGVGPLPEEFRAPVRSSLPALFVTGTLDGDTPEGDTAEVLGGFPNGQHLRVFGAAHVGLGFQDSKTRAAIVRFFEDGRLASRRIELPALVSGAFWTSRGSILCGSEYGGGRGRGPHHIRQQPVRTGSPREGCLMSRPTPGFEKISVFSPCFANLLGNPSNVEHRDLQHSFLLYPPGLGAQSSDALGAARLPQPNSGQRPQAPWEENHESIGPMPLASVLACSPWVLWGKPQRT